MGLAEVALCEQWLSEGQDLNDRSSYGLKHDVENWPDTYISNGALIAAALGMGYKYEVAGSNVVLMAGPCGGGTSKRRAGRADGYLSGRRV